MEIRVAKPMLLGIVVLLMLAPACKKKAGEPCKKKDDCAEGLVCYKSKCFKLRKPGQACKEKGECASGLECYKSKCFKLRKVGEACKEKGECAPGLACFKARCFTPKKAGEACKESGECLSGHVCFELKCAKEKQAGESCKKTVQCRKGLECFDKKCLTAAAVKKKKAERKKAAHEGYKKFDAECKKGMKYLKSIRTALSMANFGAARSYSRRSKKAFKLAGIMALLLYKKNPQFAHAARVAFKKIAKKPISDPAKVNFCNEELRKELTKLLE